MGQGGYLQLLNATPYRWVRDTTVDHPYQFESFNIQDVNAIEPGEWFHQTRQKIYLRTVEEQLLQHT
jgi:hypothetical protein